MSTKKLGGVVCAALLVSGFSSGVAAQGEEPSAFTANIGVTSNYIWRGITQSSNGPAVQGGIDYGHSSGFYIGTWLSNVDFGSDITNEVVTGEDDNVTSVESQFSSKAEYELDGYLGWGIDATENVSVDLGYVYYHYGQNESGSDFGEIYGSVGFWWFSVGAFYTVNSQIDDPADTSSFVVGDLAYYGAFSIDLAESWSLGFTIGQYDFENDSSDNELSYAYGQIDLTKSAGRYGDFTLSVSQAGEEGDPNDNPRVFVSWTKGFAHHTKND